MNDGALKYKKWIEDALRGVARKALASAAKNGLPGEHHFYLTFTPTTAGVLIPDYLRAQYPDFMTIVLQHQYENLSVSEDSFEITLSFNGKREHLVVPFNSLVRFADPSVGFNLDIDFGEEMPVQGESDGPEMSQMETQADTPNGLDENEKEDVRGEVITLDAFRKK